MKLTSIPRLLFAILTLLQMSLASYANAIGDMPAGEYRLDKSHASLHWKVSHLGLSNYTGRFVDFDAKIILNPASPTDSQVEAVVQTNSLRTDYPYKAQKDFDKKLQESSDWFNGLNFPTITFQSDKLETADGKVGKMRGILTLLGVSKPITFNVVMNGAMIKQPFSQKPTLGFSAVAVIKRSDWGFKTYVPNIGDEVEIILELEFIKDKS